MALMVARQNESGLNAAPVTIHVICFRAGIVSMFTRRFAGERQSWTTGDGQRVGCYESALRRCKLPLPAAAGCARIRGSRCRH